MPIEGITPEELRQDVRTLQYDTVTAQRMLELGYHVYGLFDVVVSLFGACCVKCGGREPRLHAMMSYTHPPNLPHRHHSPSPAQRRDHGQPALHPDAERHNDRRHKRLPERHPIHAGRCP